MENLEYFKSKFKLGTQIYFPEKHELKGYFSSIWIDYTTPQEFIDNWRKEDREKLEAKLESDKKDREEEYYNYKRRKRIFNFIFWISIIIVQYLIWVN